MTRRQSIINLSDILYIYGLIVPFLVRKNFNYHKVQVEISWNLET